MRKFLVKYFVGGWISKTHELKLVAEILLSVVITCFVQGYFKTGGVLLLLTLACYLIGDTLVKKGNFKYGNRTRVSYILFPLVVLLGNLSLFNLDNWVYIGTGLFIVLLSIPEIYFQIKTVKWEEMDDSQKLQYGYGVQGGYINKKMTAEQFEEWVKLKNQ